MTRQDALFNAVEKTSASMGKWGDIPSTDRFIEVTDRHFRKKIRQCRAARNPALSTIAKDLPTADICGDAVGGDSVATPEVAGDGDDDDGGDDDSDPDGRHRPHSITPALFTFAILQQYISLNRTRVYALIRQGKFPPPLKIGKSSRWQRSAIDGWIADQAQSTAAAR